MRTRHAFASHAKLLTNKSSGLWFNTSTASPLDCKKTSCCWQRRRYARLGHASVSRGRTRLAVLCPLLAQSGHWLVHRTCPLSGQSRHGEKHKEYLFGG